MKTITQRATPDVVSDLLESVRVRSTVYCRSDMRAPWAFGIRAHGDPSFHVVTRGDCWLDVEGEEPRKLASGDLVLLPHGPTHWMRDAPGTPALWLDDLLAGAPPAGNGWLQYGGNGTRTELVCGGFVLEGNTMNPILSPLPSVIHVRRATEAGPVPWVAATLELVGAVTASDAPGSGAVLSRLADTMLTQALRMELASLGSKQAQALRDPQIATAIHLIHTRPHEPWTVKRLAEEVGYSRSAFASRFRDLVGESPMGYVRRNRLAVAATLLQRTSMSIGELARRSGYSTEASFSRAFKRAFGVAPGGYRAMPRDSAHS